MHTHSSLKRDFWLALQADQSTRLFIDRKTSFSLIDHLKHYFIGCTHTHLKCELQGSIQCVYNIQKNIYTVNQSVYYVCAVHTHLSEPVANLLYCVVVENKQLVRRQTTPDK